MSPLSLAPWGLQILSLHPLFHTSCPELRFQPRDLVKMPLKPPQPGDPLVHHLPLGSFLSFPGISTLWSCYNSWIWTAEPSTVSFPSYVIYPILSSSWTGQLDVRNWSAVSDLPSAQYCGSWSRWQAILGANDLHPATPRGFPCPLLP